MIRIFVPYYSGKEKLQLAVASAQRQPGDAAVTILDDCSLETQGLAELEIPPNAEIDYIRNKTNLGMVGNWNLALQASEGLVAILHADDLMLENYTRAMEQVALKYPHAALYFCRAVVIDNNGRRIFSFPDFIKGVLFRHTQDVVLQGEAGVAALLRGNFIFCPTVVYNLANLGETRFDPRWKMVQDLDLLLRVLESGQIIVGISEVCYCYRRHGANATVEYTRNLLRFREENELYLESASRYRARGWAKAARLAQRRGIIKLNLLYCTLVDLLACRWSNCLSKVKLFVELFLRKR